MFVTTQVPICLLNLPLVAAVVDTHIQGHIHYFNHNVTTYIIWNERCLLLCKSLQQLSVKDQIFSVAEIHKCLLYFIQRKKRTKWRGCFHPGDKSLSFEDRCHHHFETSPRSMLGSFVVVFVGFKSTNKLVYLKMLNHMWIKDCRGLQQSNISTLVLK